MLATRTAPEQFVCALPAVSRRDLVGDSFAAIRFVRPNHGGARQAERFSPGDRKYRLTASQVVDMRDLSEPTEPESSGRTTETARAGAMIR